MMPTRVRLVVAVALSALSALCVVSSNTLFAAPAEVTFVDVAVGDGPEIRRGWFATIRYHGWIYDEQAPGKKGRKFINSDDRGAPVTFVYGYKRALPGMEKGMAGMKVGGRRTVVIPAKEGFKGARQQSPDGVSVDSDLIIDIELVDVVPQANTAPADD